MFRVQPQSYPRLAAATFSSTSGGFDSSSRNGTRRAFTSRSRLRFSAMGAGMGLAAASGAAVAFSESSEENDVDYFAGCGERDAALPDYTKEDLKAHTTQKTGVWVTFRDGVYDITDFIAVHPGGAKRIMLAAGNAVDPFWNIYQQHISKDTAGFIAATMRDMRIGNYVRDPADDEVDLDDPFKDDPRARSVALHVHTKKAFNAEPPKELLETYITPTELFYVRHHHPVPVVDDSYRLKISGLGCRDLELSLHDIKSLFPKQTVAITLQCAGNRRSGMNAVQATQGLKWGVGAISTAEFGGVWLRDVLRLAGVEDMDDAVEVGARHVQFTALDKPYDASIPVDKAVSRRGDVLLAYEMNGKPLPREHGFPIRVLVPGHLGARSVKWVEKITVSDEESYSTWQRGVAYRGFGPWVRHFGDNLDITEAPAVQELPVQSAITNIKDDDVVQVDDDGNIEVKGYAWAGGGRRIVRVDVSADGGKTWHAAEMGRGKEQPRGRAWAWTMWEATVPAPEGADASQICCKAVDEGFNTQPETPAPIWNLRGILNNSWDRVNVALRRDDDDDDDDDAEEEEGGD